MFPEEPNPTPAMPIVIRYSSALVQYHNRFYLSSCHNMFCIDSFAEDTKSYTSSIHSTSKFYDGGLKLTSNNRNTVHCAVCVQDFNPLMSAVLLTCRVNFFGGGGGG
jgi:hypothetical protein